MIRCVLWGLVAGVIIGGAGWLSAVAHADPEIYEPQVVQYVATHAAQVCTTLDDEPTVDGVADAALDIMAHSHLTAMQAGEAIGLSVQTRCPQYEPVLQQFVHAYMPSTAAVTA